VGGFGDLKPMDADAKQVFADSGAAYVLIGFVEDEGKGNVDELVLEGYKTQVVAGTNYEFMCSLGTQLNAKVKVFQPLPGTGDKPSVSEILAVPHVEETEEYKPTVSEILASSRSLGE